MTRFRLYWPRETDEVLGTEVSEGDLEPHIWRQALALTRVDDEEIALWLPFLDRRECTRRHESLRDVQLARDGNSLRPVETTISSSLKNRAAELHAFHPAWRAAPASMEASFFETWQRVAVALQRALRDRIAAELLDDLNFFEDREAVYPILMYHACRVFYGKPRTEFTHDVGEPNTLTTALRSTGRALRSVLADAERRLTEAGKLALARRYAPHWSEDVRRAVESRPSPFLALLGNESAVINAVIELGAARNYSTVKPFARACSAALRKIGGRDLRSLGLHALDVATEVLGSASRRRTA